MKPEINAEFRIISETVLPEEITERLGILPTRSIHIGDFIHQSSSQRYTANIWGIECNDFNNSISLEDYLEALLEKIEPRKSELLKMCKQSDVSCIFECSIDVNEQTPIISFPKDLILRISNLNAALDIDIILIKSD